MCLQITEYECGHVKKSIHRCLLFRQRIVAADAAQKHKGFFAQLFNPVPPITCNERAGRKKRLYFCQDCRARAQVNQEKRERRRRQEEEKAAWAFQTQYEIAQEEKERLVFRCEACRRENRWPGEQNRKANSGFCCARGAEEFEAAKRYIPQIPLQAHQADFTQAPDANLGLDQPSGNHLNRDSLQAAREAGSQAAREYGWTKSSRDSHIEPHLVAGMYTQPGYIKTSTNSHTEPHLVADGYLQQGTNLKSMPPQRPTESLPSIFVGPSLYSKQIVYKEAGIDEARWNQISRTGHGTMPPPCPPPDRPLPTIPLRIPKQSNSNGKNPARTSAKPTSATNIAKEIPRSTPREPAGVVRRRMASSRDISDTPLREVVAFESPSSSQARQTRLEKSSSRDRDLITPHLTHQATSDALEKVSLVYSQSPVSPMSTTLEGKRATDPFELLANLIDDAKDSWGGVSKSDTFI